MAIYQYITLIQQSRYCLWLLLLMLRRLSIVLVTCLTGLQPPRLTLLLMSPCECVTCSADTRDFVHILCVQPYNCRTYFIVVCIMLEIDSCHDFHMTSVHGLALEPIISTWVAFVGEVRTVMLNRKDMSSVTRTNPRHIELSILDRASRLVSQLRRYKAIFVAYKPFNRTFRPQGGGLLLLHWSATEWGVYK